MKMISTLGVLVLTVASTAALAQQAPRKPYVVKLNDAAVVRYDGRIPGLAATRPAPGARLNVDLDRVRDYIEYLDTKQSAVQAVVPAAKVTYQYRLTVNGFAAWLTDAEVAKLQLTPGVHSISADLLMPLDTASTPRFLGIDQPGGVWSKFDAQGRAIKGEGVIIGHVDGGIWPENPSVSDKVGPNGKPVASHLAGTVVYDPLPAGRWNGICQAGEGFTAAHCNNKLIGARFFNTTWKLAASLGLVTTWSGEYLDSPRDADGHGTHTLTTSGGNENTDVSINGSQFTISGIAPRARIAAYKSCYVPVTAGAPGQGSCYQSDSAAAIEAAVADGVDVINFSIGGSRISVVDVVSTAMRNAAFAGVFVSASAGNSGPGAGTVAHIAPWVMTVGNSTHDRYTEASVALGNGASATGASFQTTGVAALPLIRSIDAGVTPFASLSDVDKIALARCYAPADRASLSVPAATAAAALDPAKVAGKIVVCYRGGNVLVNKAAMVAGAGGAAMIIQNVPAGLLPAPANTASLDSVFASPYVVPAVHLRIADAAAVLGHAAGPGATAAFGPSANVGQIAPVMNASSSRGPQQGDPNVLKPDITAPGTDIIAAYTNQSITPAQRLEIIAGTLVPGPGANMISGTSMSAPHVAGAAALLRQANPTWSPYAIKSALMTSAQQTVKLASGSPDPSPWNFGAGHLNLNGALATTVVYDQTNADHDAYRVGALNGRNLNLASLTHPNIVGVANLTRTLTNKGASTVTYSASASLAGFAVTISPASLTLAPGASASYTVTLRRQTAPIEQWVFGHVTWSSSGEALRSPLQAKASELIAPAQVTDARAVGTKVYSVATGYDGALLLQPIGLVPATRNAGSVALDARVCFPVTVPSGARQFRVQLFNSEVEGGATSDLDVVVLRGSTEVGSSLNADSNELVTLTNPAAGGYQACVDGFAPVNGRAAFTLSHWVVGPAVGTQSLRAFGPRSVRTGGVASVGLSWSVAAGARYLGVVDYRSTSGAAPIGSTAVFIDNAPASSAATAAAPAVRDKSAR